jgi:hypothetical protein
LAGTSSSDSAASRLRSLSFGEITAHQHHDAHHSMPLRKESRQRSHPLAIFSRPQPASRPSA